MFVTTENDQSITWMKTFTSTIISSGVQYSGNDNNSVFLADGGVKAIQDINASVDLQNYNYNKSQTYSQTQTNNLLNNKVDSEVLYSKCEDDALLLLKADKKQLIDAYTKGDADNLQNNKTDSGVSCTKQENDALLLLNADKTQLIGAYTKGETNNLINNKADSGVSYSKVEDDALLLLKTDKIQLVDSYTKGDADNLLNNKAQSSTTQTYTETDQLIQLIDVSDINLSGYMTLDSAQTINANKTFNICCRFVSSIDGMSTVTGSSFFQSDADNTVVLIGAGVTKQYRNLEVEILMILIM
ncbi:MAG: hypothetical protein EZS28_009763 [Streblomastix strix]|uniref:Uncharacterized protein n=1 Tax=Streblomastix strix TaxID=222440 RepID=A0A5J4WK94_9EUKA|nr:MAG: hypothetical protein EZS28_009763 [Streblomastix strix]